VTETVASSCQDCYSRANGFPCIYDMTCSDCRVALLVAEPCKVLRKAMAESIEKKWGEVGNWKVDPNCGCGKTCERLANKRGNT
jgi:hypothetical protein